MGHDVTKAACASIGAVAAASGAERRQVAEQILTLQPIAHGTDRELKLNAPRNSQTRLARTVVKLVSRKRREPAGEKPRADYGNLKLGGAIPPGRCFPKPGSAKRVGSGQFLQVPAEAQDARKPPGLRPAPGAAAYRDIERPPPQPFCFVLVAPPLATVSARKSDPNFNMQTWSVGASFAHLSAEVALQKRSTAPTGRSATSFSPRRTAIREYRRAGSRAPRRSCRACRSGRP